MIENLTHPGEDPVTGDIIRITYPSGAVEEKPFFEIDTTPSPPNYKPLTKLQAVAMLVSFAGMSPAQHLAFRKDPNLELFWMQWRDDVPTEGIRRDSQLTQDTLAAIVATGHMTQAQSDALMAAWPTV